MVYKLRETIPNPAGGDYPVMPDAAKDALVTLLMERFSREIQKVIIPNFVRMHAGDTRAVATCLATLFSDELKEFMEKNRAEDQKPTHEAWDEAIACFVAAAERQQGVQILVDLGITDKNVLANAVLIKV